MNFLKYVYYTKEKEQDIYSKKKKKKKNPKLVRRWE